MSISLLSRRHAVSFRGDARQARLLAAFRLSLTAPLGSVFIELLAVNFG